MSRIGRQPVKIGAGVTVTVGDGNQVTVKGPKGTLEQNVSTELDVTVGDGEVVVVRKNDGRIARAQHGLARTLIQNMAQGVVEPFKKSLEISGVGYRAEMVGEAIKLQVGLSHEVLHPIPRDVECKIEKQTLVHLTSPDKELVGRVAAALRAYRPCEPYKGKGIKYVGERVRRKEGKTGAA